MEYTSKNYKFSISIDTNGFYVGCKKFALSFDRRDWKSKPKLYHRNPKTFIGYGFFIRMEEVRL